MPTDPVQTKGMGPNSRKADNHLLHLNDKVFRQKRCNRNPRTQQASPSRLSAFNTVLTNIPLPTTSPTSLTQTSQVTLNAANPTTYMDPKLKIKLKSVDRNSKNRRRHARNGNLTSTTATNT